MRCDETKGRAVPALLVGIIEGAFIGLVGVFLLQVPFNGSLSLLFGSMAIDRLIFG